MVWVSDSASEWCVMVWVSDGVSVCWCEWVMVWVCVGVSVCWCEWVMVWVCVGVSEWWCEWVMCDGVSECWTVRIENDMTLHDRNIMIYCTIARLMDNTHLMVIHDAVQHSLALSTLCSWELYVFTCEMNNITSLTHSHHHSLTPNTHSHHHSLMYHHTSLTRTITHSHHHLLALSPSHTHTNTANKPITRSCMSPSSLCFLILHWSSLIR